MTKYYKTNNEIRAIEEGQEFLIQSDWVELTQEELQAIINPPKTPEQIEAELIAHFKSLYLNTFNAKLKELDYDGIETVTLWANKSDSAFQAEAQSLLNWYEACVLKNYEILNAVKAGTRTVPTDDEYLSELPKMEVI